MEEESKKEKKNKKYHSTRSGLTRIIALILAIIMCFAATASLIFMLIG